MIEAIRQILIDSTDITDKVPTTRIFLNSRSQSSPLPAILIEKQSVAPNDVKERTSGVDLWTVNVTVFAEDYIHASWISRQIRTIIDGYAGNVDIDTGSAAGIDDYTIAIGRVSYNNEVDLWDDQNSGLQVISQSYLVWEYRTGSVTGNPPVLMGGVWVVFETSDSNFPEIGSSDVLYGDTTTKMLYYWSGSTYVAWGTGGGGGSTTWGSITGILSSQTDLSSAFAAKVAANSAITAGTGTKITVDAKGLVTGYTNATASDVGADPAGSAAAAQTAAESYADIVALAAQTYAVDHADEGLSGKAALSHTHTASHITDFNTAALSAAPAETASTIGALIDGASSKTTPVDDDQIGLMDSAASNVLKKLSWANLKAALTSVFMVGSNNLSEVSNKVTARQNIGWRDIGLPADFTTTSNVLADVTDFYASVAANKNYRGEMNFALSGSTSGVRFAFVFPAGATLYIGLTGTATGTTAQSMVYQTPASGSELTFSFSSSGVTSGYVEVEFYLVMGSTAGNLQVQMKSTTNTQSNTLYAGFSHIEIREV